MIGLRHNFVVRIYDDSFINMFPPDFNFADLNTGTGLRYTSQGTPQRLLLFISKKQSKSR